MDVKKLLLENKKRMEYNQKLIDSPRFQKKNFFGTTDPTNLTKNDTKTQKLKRISENFPSKNEKRKTIPKSRNSKSPMDANLKIMEINLVVENYQKLIQKKEEELKQLNIEKDNFQKMINPNNAKRKKSIDKYQKPKFSLNEDSIKKNTSKTFSVASKMLTNGNLSNLSSLTKEKPNEKEKAQEKIPAEKDKTQENVVEKEKREKSTKQSINNKNNEDLELKDKPKNFFFQKSKTKSNLHENYKVINKTFDLSEDELVKYGNRFPSGFEKNDLLGKGGFALVWLGTDITSSKQYALKQIARNNFNENTKNELIFYEKLNCFEFASHPGQKNIAKLFQHFTTKNDLFLVFELGGNTLSKVLFDMKGTFYKGERVYQITYSPLYSKLIWSEKTYMKNLISSVAHVLQLLSMINYVHCDLKPENILANAEKVLNYIKS